MTDTGFVPLTPGRRLSPAEMEERATAFREQMQGRRTVREFSSEPISRTVIEQCLLAAGSAPSGANRQPWHFVVVQDPDVKRRLREAAEKEEYEFYHGRAGEEWLEALTPLATDHQKAFLEEAPCLIVVFGQSQGGSGKDDTAQNYYVRHSVGIATGMLITAVHNAGLACLTYTPSRMSFLNKVLERGDTERPFLVLVVGCPADGVTVPDLDKKGIDDISTFV